jgi:hypothetical protein
MGAGVGAPAGSETALAGSAVKVPPGNTMKPPLPDPPAYTGRRQLRLSAGVKTPPGEDGGKYGGYALEFGPLSGGEGLEVGGGGEGGGLYAGGL